MSKFKFNKKILFLIIILTASFLCLPACRFLEQQGFIRRKVLKEALLWAKQDSARVADSLRRSGFVKSTEVFTLQDSLIETRNKKIPTENQYNKYHVIVGSFSNIENAKLCSKEYFKKGFKTNLMTSVSRSGIKFELVSVKSFDNSSEAKKYLKKFQLEIDSTAWIYSE